MQNPKAPLSLADLIERIALSRLLAPAQMSALRRQALEFSGTSRDLAASLVQQQILTAYQARHLLAGRAMGFFLKQYRIQEPLGQGGMGFVMRVVDTRTSQPVALKLLPHEATRDAERVARFHREARAAMKLRHPNIVRTFELGQEGQLHFIAMELVEGLNLKELIARDGRLTPGTAVHIIIQIARALQCAAEHGIVHRDIKPSNIIVTPDGHSRLLDLGLARFSDPQTAESSLVSPLTQTGHMMGTVDFVAPEQAEDPRAADSRSDIYSLGCSLYQCLTGHVPFPDGTFVQKLLKHRQDDAIRPSQLVPGLDPGLSRVVEQMMAKHPEDRLPTATAVIEALSEFESTSAIAQLSAVQQPPETTVATAPVAASQELTSAAGQATSLELLDNITDISPLDNLLLMRERRGWSPRKMISWAAVVAVWMLIAGFWYWMVSGEGTIVISFPENPDSNVQLTLDDRPFPQEGPAGQPTAIATGPHQLSISSRGYKSQTLSFAVERNRQHELQIVLEPTTDTLRQRELSRLIAALDESHSKHPDLLPARNALRAFQLKTAGTPEAVQAGTKLNSLPAPIDGLQRQHISREHLATSGILMDNQPPAAVVAILGDGRLKHWQSVMCVAFSPDGRYMASGGWCELRLHEVETGHLLRSFFHPGRVAAVSFNADGTQLAAVDWNRHGVVRETETGKQVTRFHGRNGIATDVAFHPDGKQLAVAEKDRTVTFWDPGNSSLPAGSLTDHDGMVLSLDFNTDGSRLATATCAGSIYLWDVTDVRNPSRLWQITAHDHRPDLDTCRITVAFQPRPAQSDERLLLGSCGMDGLIKLWDAEKGELQSTLTGHSGNVNDICFSPDGQLIYSTGRDRTIRTWNAGTGKEHDKALTQVTEFDSIACSRDGQYLAGGSIACEAKIWNLASRSPLHSITGHFSQLKCLDISPDETQLATGGTDGRIIVWDLSNGSLLQTLKPHTNYVSSVLFSRDGRTLMSASLDGSIRSWNLTAENDHQVIRSEQSRPVYSMDSDPEHHRLVTGDSHGRIQFQDPLEPSIDHEFESGQDKIHQILLNPDGSTMASLSRNQTSLHIWDTVSEDLVKTLDVDGSTVWSATFSPEGSTIWAGTRFGTLGAYDTSSWKTRWKTPTPDPYHYVLCMAVSPDGQILATGANDGVLRLWNATTGELLHEVQISPNKGLIDQILFTPEGRHLVTANANGTAYVLRLSLLGSEQPRP